MTLIFYSARFLSYVLSQYNVYLQGLGVRSSFLTSVNSVMAIYSTPKPSFLYKGVAFSPYTEVMHLLYEFRFKYYSPLGILTYGRLRIVVNNTQKLT